LAVGRTLMDPLAAETLVLAGLDRLS
jgi:hypothetical protein